MEPTAGGEVGDYSPAWRRPAITATLVTLPVVVVLALVFGRVAGGSDYSRPVASGSAVACRRLLAQLPEHVDGLPRDSAATSRRYTAAWGTPPVVLRCGVPRPAELVAGSTAQLIGSGRGGSVNWLPVVHASATVWTTVDRAVYIELSVPTSYATPPLASISDAVEKVLPAVCTVSMPEPPARRAGPRRPVLCTHRR